MKKALMVCLLLLGVSCTWSSKLRVTRAHHPEAFPIYLPRQDFVISELGFDAKGKTTKNTGVSVELVTRADPEQLYYVRNERADLADSEFTVVRKLGGQAMSLNGGVTSQARETIELVVTTLVGVAAMAGFVEPPEPAALTDLKKEVEDLKKLIKNLAAQLRSEANKGTADAKKVKALEETLALSRERLSKVQAEIAAKKNGARGIGKSGPYDPGKVTVQPVDAYSPPANLQADHIQIFIVPVDAEGGA